MSRSGRDTGLARFPQVGRASSFILGAVLLFCSVSWLREGKAATLTLRLTPASLSFPDADPDVVPQIGPATVNVEVKATAAPGYIWALTLLGNSDLRSGVDVIPISAITWTSSPNPPFRDGTLSRVSPITLGSGIAHINTTLRMDFRLQNSWTYNAGIYSATATFTLTAP